MPVRHIPSQETRRWSGPYLGNYYGNLWKTFNVDLDREEGKIGLSRRLTIVADTTDTNSDTLAVAVAFLRTNADCIDRYWAVSDSARLYRVDSSPIGDWQVDSLDSSPTNAKDFTVFEKDTRGDSINRQQLFVTTDSDIAVLNDTGTPTWDGDWWTTAPGGTHAGDSALDTGVPHPIEYFPLRRIVLVGSKNKIHTISRTGPTVNETTAVNRLVLPQDLQVQHIFTTTNRAWILCANVNNAGNGKVVEWDGFAQTYNEIYDINSPYPLSGISYREIPIVINNKGLILEYTGRGFSPMIRNGQQISLPVFEETENAMTVTAGSLIGGMYPRGMTVGEDGLVYIAIRQPSNPSFRNGGGIWCLNPITGRLYLKYAVGAWTNTSYGEQRTLVGGLYSIPFATSNATLLIGGGYNNNDINFDRTAIWTLTSIASTTATRGYFTTQWIPSDEIEDFWDSLWIHFRRFITATNRIVVKARGVKPLIQGVNYGFALEATITWVNATSFTVTLAASDEALAVGDEVEMIQGVNSGTLSHITVISGAHGAVQTITIDETLTASTNSGRARFDRWKKLGVISNPDKYKDVLPVGIRSDFVQFKIEMRGPVSEMAISSLVVNTNPSAYNKK